MYHPSQMRRALSISLILLFLAGPLSAISESIGNVRLPACCRRTGAHRCAETMQRMIMTVTRASGEPMLTAVPTCPQFPGSSPMTVSAQHAVTALPVNLPVALAQPHSPASSRTAARVSQLRTRADRGPPIPKLI